MKAVNKAPVTKFNPTATSAHPARRKAAAFLNIVIVAKNGTTYRPKDGVPLYASEEGNTWQDKLIEAALACPELKVTVEGSIHIVAPEVTGPIEF